MATTTDVTVLPLPTALTTLSSAVPTDGHVLSVYLDTGPTQTKGPAYLFAYRDGCKALREVLPPAARAAFEAAAARAERYLTTEFVPGQPGVAVFASGQPDYCYAVPLPAAPGDDVSWEARPQLEPLHALLDEYERIGVVLVDKERARLFTVFLGQIEERREIVDVVPGKQATGGWYALAQTRYARHHEEHVRRHVTRTTAALLALLRARPFDRLLVGGPDEALALLRAHLPRPLRARLAGTLTLALFADEAEVLQATLYAAEALERQAEVRAIDELSEAATTPHAVLGVEATLEALHERRVHRLFMADRFARTGGACRGCGRLTGTHERCPACGGRLEPIADLREMVLIQAMEQDARIEVVAGAASERLMAFDGLGAQTWY